MEPLKSATQLSLEDAVKIYGKHGVHVMLWAPLDHNHPKILMRYKGRAAVLMQMRFDGSLGFPGGLVDEDIADKDLTQVMEVMVQGLNRELEEEVGVDVEAKLITAKDYLFSMRGGNCMICHFFSYEMTLDKFKELEKKSLDAKDYGNEVMGHFRVPLYTMKDGTCGFPRFLQNAFVGPAKQQLFRGLIGAEIFTYEEIKALDKDFVY